MTDLTSKLAEIARRRSAAAPSVSLTSRSLSRLDAGTHDVRIEAVNTSCLETRGFIDLTYGDAQERTHRDRIWVLSRDGQQLSYRLRQLVQALFDRESDWLALVDQNQEQAFHMLRGMKLKVTLVDGPGYQVHSAPAGWQAVLSGQIVAAAPTIQEVHQKAQAAGHRRSWLQVKGVTGDQHLDYNQQALDNAAANFGSEADTDINIEAHLRRLSAD